MPATFPVSVLLEQRESTGETLPPPGQATRRQMAPDRRRAGTASEKATPTTRRFGLTQTIVH
jgi:hypothetical protein